MNVSFDSYLSINEILADALRIVDDEDMRIRNIGWYKRQVKTCLEQLNFRTHFDERYSDFDIPSNKIIKLPKGAWNIKEVYVYNTDCFSIDSSRRVFHKDNFISNEKGGYTARNKTDQRDYFINSHHDDSYLHFYNVQNGNIHFSDACLTFDKIRIVYNGMASDVDDVKIIPPFIREAVVGYVAERFFFSLKSKDIKYRVLWADAKADLYTQKSRHELSTWDEAKYMLKRIDDKHRTDMNEYWGRLNA